MGKRKSGGKDGGGQSPAETPSEGRSEAKQGSGASGSGRGGAGSARGGRGDGKGGRKSWMQTHGRDLRFLAIFALLMSLYYLASTTAFAQEKVFPSYLRLNARVAGVILSGCGYEIRVHDKTIIEPRWSVTVGRGCDAVQPSALFVSAVLASPVALSSSLPAAVVGTIILMTINLIRIISLLLTGIYTPKLFEVMHLDVWQALFIFLAILFWALWASRLARKRRKRVRDATS
ncbi:MAG: archaeosortase/exosortase family protein [Planctomycetota bacterium]|jgi:exosortase/archaeosortase family protein